MCICICICCCCCYCCCFSACNFSQCLACECKIQHLLRKSSAVIGRLFLARSLTRSLALCLSLTRVFCYFASNSNIKLDCFRFVLLLLLLFLYSLLSALLFVVVVCIKYFINIPFVVFSFVFCFS